MKLLPLGTVIIVNNHKVCIIGYSTIEKESITSNGYLVVSYPVGFTKIEKTFFIPCDAEFEIIAEGYKTIPSEKILETLGKGFKLAEKFSLAEMEALYDVLEKRILSRKEVAVE